MTDYSITLPSYSIGEQVYKQIPTVCAPFGATAVVIGGHKAMAAGSACWPRSKAAP